jgi:uncharacterized protein YndB with AHSA1/START domain/uncharacterized protein YciI
MTRQHKSRARALADLSSGTILAVVEIAAAPERVFAALTTGDDVMKWWGSDDTYRTTEWQADVRVGGKWHASGRGADGRTFTVRGEFLEIVPSRRIVQTWIPTFAADLPTRLRYEIEPIEDGARLTLWHEGFADHRGACEGHTRGWEQVLGWLTEYLAPPAERRCFLCRLIPPRPTFAQDMSADERKVMNDHVAYWTGLAHKGVAKVFGPVADPKGVYGVGIIDANDERELDELKKDDPAIRSGLGFRYEAFAMPRVVFGS